MLFQAHLLRHALGPAGDWFNRLDWSLQSNNFGVGLPPAGKNQGSWGLHRPLLADPALRPPPPLIAHAKARPRSPLRLGVGRTVVYSQTQAWSWDMLELMAATDVSGGLDIPVFQVNA